MRRVRTWLAMPVLLGALAAAAAGNGRAQLPAGTHSAEEPTTNAAADAQIQAAESALEQGDFPAAEARLKALHTEHPQDARVLYDLGFAQEHNREEAAAAESYAAAVAADGTLAEPRVALGLLEARSGHAEEAHRQLQAAANLATASPALRGRALRALASLDEREHPEAAQQELLAALRLTAETPADSLLAVELAERAGDAADAEAAYRRVLAAHAGDVEATVGLAHTLEQQKKYAEAEALLQQALAPAPGSFGKDDPRLVAQLALAYANDGKADQAIALIEPLRKQDAALAADPALTRMLARLYTVAGNDAAAEPLLQGLAAASPSDGPLLDDLGGAEVKRGEYAAAEATLARAVELKASFASEQDWAEAEGHLAFAASKNGDPKGTLQALAARATVLPNSGASLFLEATAYDTLHQSKQAAQAYKAFLAIANGKFPDQEFQARHRLAALATMR